MSSMPELSWHEAAAKQARILQIIVAVLMIGCLFFLIIVLIVGPIAKPAHPLLPVSLTMIACGLVGIELIAQVVVVWSIAKKARHGIIDGTYTPVDPRQTNDQSSDYQCLLSVFQTKTIISGALFEGLAFFSTIAYMLEGDPIALALTVLMILAVAAQFPTQSRVIGWVERQIEAIGQEKMLR